MSKFLISEKALRSNARATFYPTSEGLRLARVQVFDTPRFKPTGWEVVNDDSHPFDRQEESPLIDVIDRDEQPHAAERLDIIRAARRARRNAFDLIMSNPDLDAFATFTYSPDSVDDKSSYSECYRYLRSWLSNGVQRRDLRYLCVPELTKKGDIHFHAICNADALKLEAARSPAGRLVKHHGDQVYNIIDWHKGFSTMQFVKRRSDGDDPVEAVAKYIFKYMGKNLGAKIGGRYVLTGGKLAHPFYAYGDGVEDFLSDVTPEEYCIELPNGGKYWEYDFLKGDTSENRNMAVDTLGM